MSPERQIDRIYNLIMELASGNLSYRAELSEEQNELDAITTGINMLAEELQATTVSKEYLGRIYGGVVDILLVLNPDFTIQAINEAVTRQLNYTEEELIGQHVSVLFYRNETKWFDRIYTELEKKGFTYDTERVLRTKKDKPIPVSISAAALHNDVKEINGILCIAKDISHLKKTEEELRQKNEELNSFIYRVSHDIKGPLSSILGLIYLAKSEIDDLEAVSEYVNLIEQSANRLDRIIAELLELGRISRNEVKYSTVNIRALIDEVMQSLAYTPEYQGVAFAINIQTPLIRAKKVLLKTVLQNLIYNAILYKNTSAETPYVKINAEETDTEHIIHISDNGVGMDKHTQENIFKMFFRGDQQSKGTGLGLYIVKTSVDAMKGRIEVKSKFGQGTTFSIYLPKKKAKSLRKA